MADVTEAAAAVLLKICEEAALKAGAAVHAEWKARWDATVPALRAENEQLRARLEKLARQEEFAIEDRDRYSDWANRMAYAIAPAEVIGEHTSTNNPWAGAIEEARRLRAERDELARGEHRDDWRDVCCTLPALHDEAHRLVEASGTVVRWTPDDDDDDGTADV